MGGGPKYPTPAITPPPPPSMTASDTPQTEKKKDHLLVILPFPPDALKPYLAALAAKHNLTTTYIQQTHPPTVPLDQPTPLAPSTYAHATHLLTLSALPPSPSAAPRLRLIQLFSAGWDHLPAHTPILAPDAPTTLTTSSGVHGPQIAEWVFGALLAHTHGLAALRDAQRAHRWTGNVANPTDQVGATLGVLGYGSIGRQVGRVGQALGMRVLAYTAGPRDTAESRRDGGYVVPGTGDAEGTVPAEWFSGTGEGALRRFLGEGIDVLVVCVPLSAGTRGLLGQGEFEALAEGLKGKERRPFVVNISRGPIVVTDDLVAALQAGVLGGAALDVTDPEPLPQDSPLWDMANVTVTPHVSGRSTHYVGRCVDILDQNLGREARGEELLNVVKKRKADEHRE